ncbi:hypothetical protein [Corynebacterium callunae]|uniref:Uncharacterized protein n=1 Tax=Corynebacterium callunae DSM 20147 TaxID=1121353 RepID=M1UZ28_9CORY|nr:hypothetical protein [Corynebacterium callunae]AGG66913.1 hypothetical protein H924_07355 [Corynebacterium callunae DSM 20147]
MTDQSDKDRRAKIKILKILGIIIAVIFAFIIFVSVVGSSGSDDEATTSETPTSETPTSEAATSETVAAQETTSENVMPWTRHEMCQPDDGTAAMLTGVLHDQSLTLANAQLIKDGSDTWIGASLVRPDGEFESRSDVWLLQDGALYSVSSGAQSNSWAVQNPDSTYGMANEYAAGVDRCVVAESMGK